MKTLVSGSFSQKCVPSVLSAFSVPDLWEAVGTQPLNVPQKFIFQWGEITVGKCCNEIKLDSEVAGIFLEKWMAQEAEIQWKGCSNVRGWEKNPDRERVAVE